MKIFSRKYTIREYRPNVDQIINLFFLKKNVDQIIIIFEGNVDQIIVV